MKSIVYVNDITQCIESIRAKNFLVNYRHSIEDCKNSIANMLHSA